MFKTNTCTMRGDTIVETNYLGEIESGYSDGLKGPRKGIYYGDEYMFRVWFQMDPTSGKAIKTCYFYIVNSNKVLTNKQILIEKDLFKQAGNTLFRPV